MKHVILGGTKQEGNYNLAIDETDKKHILEGCYKLIPGLKVRIIVVSNHFAIISF